MLQYRDRGLFLLYLQFKWRNNGSGLGFVDAFTAKIMPPLRLPTMPPPARQALQKVIRYEKIQVDRSFTSILRLAEARGFSVHPSDWVPHPDCAPPVYPELYRPWAVWLAEQGYTPYGIAYPVNIDSLEHFKPTARRDAFRSLYQKNRTAAYELLRQMPGAYSAEMRLDMLPEIGGGASFSGIYPSDVPIMEYYLNDRSKKIRVFAEQRLKQIGGLETAEANARHIAQHLIVQNEIISLPEEARYQLYKHFCCTTSKLSLKRSVSLPCNSHCAVT